MTLTLKDITIDAEDAPKLYVAYLAAMRAEYYARLDAARDGADFQTSFDYEYRNGLRDPDELEDWRANNTNPPAVQPCDIIAKP